MKDLLILLLLLAACGHDIDHGKITDMYIEPPRDYILMMPIPHTVGKVTFYTYIPIPMHDDADYVLMVDGFTKDGEEKTEMFYVDSDHYDRYKIGASFCLTEGCSPTPNEDVRK